MMKTGNQVYIEQIGKMSEFQLLDEVIENPSYLTDSYYSEFADAIHNRYDELRQNPDKFQVLIEAANKVVQDYKDGYLENTNYSVCALDNLEESVKLFNGEPK